MAPLREDRSASLLRVTDEVSRDAEPDTTRAALLRAELAKTTVEGQGRVGHQIPTEALYWLVGAILLLGGGGVIGEHFLGRIGQVTSTTVTGPASRARAGTPASIGVKVIDHVSAAPFTLRDSRGGTWSLSQSRGQVTLVTFFSARCNDVCPVEGAEIRQLLADLAPQHVAVTVDIINTDPAALGATTSVKALTATHLGATSSVHFLSGSLSALDAVWSSYGVQVKVGATTQEVAHNDLLYFVGRTGALSAAVTPLTNESLSGTFSLPHADMVSFAKGLAAEVTSLSR